MTEKILIVDDKQSIIEILDTTLRESGYETSSALDGQTAMDMIESDVYDLILCDVNLPDIQGTELLKRAKALPSPPTVIMITAYGSIENAIECMKLGADDYVSKPFNLGEINEIVKKGLEKARLVRENIMLRAEVEKKYDFSGIIGKSKAIQDIFEKIRRVAPTNVSILITGETGVGKELISKAIHYNSGRAGKMVAVNCAAIPDNLLESELFGHARGAFTGAVTAKRGLIEEADNGTLLLDEIAELQPPLQAKLLRTLDEGTIRRVGDTRELPVKVRLISSTNRDLMKEVEANRFRLDLYHRVKVVEIIIPPLRERREDILPLSEYFLKKICMDHGKAIRGFSSKAANMLLSHDWKGNVREMINALEQAVLLCDADVVEEESLALVLSPAGSDIQTSQLMREGSLKDMLNIVEKDIIEKILREVGGSRKEAARRLAMSERALYYKLENYGIK